MYSLVTYYPDLRYIGFVCQSESWDDIVKIVEQVADDEDHILTEEDRKTLNEYNVCRLHTVHLFITNQSYVTEDLIRNI